MKLIQWFIRLVKRDMMEYEVKAEVRQKIYSAVKTKLEDEDKIAERGGKGSTMQRQSALPELAKKEALGFYIRILTGANIIWRFSI